MENKRIYTEEDAKLLVIGVLWNMADNGKKEQRIDNSSIYENFNRFGQPYEPATPPANPEPAPMCDEDKVWHAAVKLYYTELSAADCVKYAFILLDELRRQQKEREGKA